MNNNNNNSNNMNNDNNNNNNNNHQRNYNNNSNNNRKNGKYSSNRIMIPWLRKKNQYEEKKSLIDKLDQEIRDFVEYIKSTEEEKRMRNYVIEKLNNVVKRIWPDATMQVYGSFPLDLYLPVSDIDIVINGGIKYTDGPIYKLADELERNNFYDQMNLISTAKIPIIKVSEKLSKCNIDITFDHTVNCENLQLLVNQYSNEFPELKPLLLILKYVLYQRNLNIPFQGGLGSFALLVLLRHFLCYYMGKKGFGPTAKFYQQKNENSEKSENEKDTSIKHHNGSYKDGLENVSKNIPLTTNQKTSKNKKRNKKRNASGPDSSKSTQNVKLNSKESVTIEKDEQIQFQSQINGDYYKYNSNTQNFEPHSPSKTFNHSNVAPHKNAVENNHQNNNNNNNNNGNQKNNKSKKPENAFDIDTPNKKRNQIKRPNLGELLVNFFKYFGEFNFVSNGVTADGTFSKEERGCVDQKIPWKMFIEDPITPNNNLGAATYHILTIRDFFKNCHDVLTDENAKSFSLLTRIIVLDPHLDKYRAHLGYQFGDKTSQSSGSNNGVPTNGSGGNGNVRYSNQYHRPINSHHNSFVNQKTSSDPLY